MHVRASSDEGTDPDELLARGYSIEESARRLGVGRSTTCELIASGELESITIGRRRIIPESAIRDFLARRLAAGRAERAGAEVR